MNLVFEKLRRKGLGRRVPAWSWANVLSLDAVAVGLLWQLVFTVQYCERAPKAYELFVIGSSVWLVYTADRLFDSFKLNITRPHTLRHRFHLRHRTGISLMWILVLALDASVIVSKASESQLRWGCAATAIAITYVVGAQLSRPSTRWMAKELQVGIVFSFGVSLTAWSEVSSADYRHLLVATATTALLFAANCLAIARWESDLDRRQSFASSALEFPTLSSRLPLMILFHACLVLGLWCGGLLADLVATCLGASDMLLAGLLVFKDRRRVAMPGGNPSKARTDLRVVLADLALAGPPLCWTLCWTLFGMSWQ